MQAAGAEAETASVQSQAEDEGWIKAELYVLLSFRGAFNNESDIFLFLSEALNSVCDPRP